MDNFCRWMIFDRLQDAIKNKEELTLKSFIQSLPLSSQEVILSLKEIAKELSSGEISLSPELAKLITDMLSEEVTRLKQIFISQQTINKFFEQ